MALTTPKPTSPETATLADFETPALEAPAEFETLDYGLSPKEFALSQAVQLYARVNANPTVVVAAAQRFEAFLAS